MYLATDANEMLRPILEKNLRPGARVVSHDFAVPNWKPKLVDKEVPEARGHVIYLYQIAAKKKEPITIHRHPTTAAHATPHWPSSSHRAFRRRRCTARSGTQLD